MVADLKLDSIKVKPGRAPGLAERDTRSRVGLTGKTEAATLHLELLGRLQTLQNRLWAEQRRSLLLVLQGMDASGKDGTIRAVFSGINPQGCRVTSFKAPEGKEAGHDYLWRVHEVCPRVVRSASSIARTTKTCSRCACATSRRSQCGVCATATSASSSGCSCDEGTTVVKVFLHISFDEQRKRLQARIDDPEKRWKFRMADLDDRAHWDAYRKAYEEAITETSTAWAPWYVVPADRKWVRNALVSQLLVDVLEAMGPRIPEPEQGIEGVVVT